VIEPIMYFAVGFLAASLLALVIMPFVHGRAVRLTVRRLEALTPVSMAEIQADKDQLRAEFAMSTRRLEMSLEQLKSKTTSQLADLGKKSEAINRLQLELGEKTAAIFALEARDKALRDQLRATEDELSVKSSALQEAETALADKEAELLRLTGDHDGDSIAADSQRVEIVALRAQIEALKDRIAELENEVKDTGDRFSRERVDADAASRELTEQRGTVERVSARVAHLERQLAGQTAEAEIVSRRAADLESRLAEQARLLGDRERERDQLRIDLAAARRIEADLREELARIDRRHAVAAEAMRTERSIAEAQLERAHEERAHLQRELAGIKREAEATWGQERVENALLREHINDVAAEVARLTAALEGPGSAIELILGPDASQSTNGVPNTATPTGSPVAVDDSGSSLADRIRALQARASRVPSPT
jgi:chromosome segregation ATPase